MRQTLLMVSLLALAACGPEAPVASWDEAEVAARSAPVAAGFQAQLQAQLQQALASGGPEAAVSVCQQAAPAIAAAQGEEAGAIVRRVSDRTRNPDAGLDADLRPHYAALAAMPMADGQPATRIWQSGNGEATRVNYLAAIPMKEQPCAVCHGANIDPALDAHIKGLYPADAATGFAPGELRGALLISWPAAIFEEG